MVALGIFFIGAAVIIALISVPLILICKKIGEDFDRCAADRREGIIIRANNLVARMTANKHEYSKLRIKAVDDGDELLASHYMGEMNRKDAEIAKVKHDFLRRIIKDGKSV